MNRVELVRPASLDPSVPYAYASVVGPGSLVFTAGACPLDDAGEVVHPGDVAAQAERVMANLGSALSATGCTLADVAKSTVYVASDGRHYEGNVTKVAEALGLSRAALYRRFEKYGLEPH